MSKHHKDDLEFEPEEEIASEENLANKLKSLRAELKESQSKAAEYLAGWQRAKADYLNLQKSEAEAKAKTRDLVTEAILLDLLSLADSFDLAMSNKQAWEEAPPNWRQGVEYIYGQLQNIFRDYNLEVLNPVGETFDPYLHHATQTVSGGESGTIASVLQKGYKLKDKIIRPAQVKIYE